MDTTHIFSCRFERTGDYTRLIIAADKAGVFIHTQDLQHERIDESERTFPDVAVEFSAQVEKEKLLRIMREQDDLHVGMQSLRQVPLKANSLERDHSVI